MSSQSIKFILEGVDEATPTFEKVSGALKETGSQSQKVSGVFAKIFGQVGLDELADYASQFGNISGQMKDLGEAGTKGGLGMLAAKAGIVAAVGAATFSVGKMIGDWIWETEAWRLKMQDAFNELTKGEERVRAGLTKQFNLKLQIAMLAESEAQKQAELAQIESQLTRDITMQQGFLDLRKKALDDAAASNYFGLNAENVELEKQALKAEQEKLDLLKQQRDEVRDIQNVSADEQLLLDRQQAEKDRKKAADEAKKAEQEAYAEFKRAVEDARCELEQKEARDKTFLDNLKATNIELTEGKRAADEFRASLAGVSAEVINAGREMQIQNELLEAQAELAKEQAAEDKERRKALAEPTSPLAAVQSRMLTRASTGGGDRVAKATEKTAELTEKIEKLQQELLTEQRKRPPVAELAIAGG
jgi:hypothetical protein